MSDEGERIQSLDELNQRQDRIESKLDQLLSLGSKREPDADGDATPDGRPASIQEQVRRELEKAEAEKQAAAAKDSQAEEHKTLREQVAEMRAKMAEKPPQAPQPRRQRVMWGPR